MRDTTMPQGTGPVYNPEWTAQHFDAFGRREWDRLVATPVDEVSSLWRLEYDMAQYNAIANW